MDPPTPSNTQEEKNESTCDPPTPSNLKGESSSNDTTRNPGDHPSSIENNFQRVGVKKKKRGADRRNITLGGMKKMEKSAKRKMN